MNELKKLLFLAGSLLLLSIDAMGQGSGRAQEFVLIFSNNLQAELEPCG